MENEGVFRAMNVSATGLDAQWRRIQMIASNVANAETTRTPQGGPYQPKKIVFSTIMDGLQGVKVEGVFDSDREPRLVQNPGHPDADDEGFVRMPDVNIPEEMVGMMAASRAYEANLAVMDRFRKVTEEAFNLLR